MSTNDFISQLLNLFNNSPDLVFSYIDENIFEDYSQLQNLYPEFYCLIKNRITFKDICCGTDCFLGLRTDNTLLMMHENGCQSKYEWVNKYPRTDLFTQISAGDFHFVALREDGTIFVWSDNSDDQLNNKPSGIFRKISCGSLHTTALRDDGTVITWGGNNHGQLNGQPKGKFTDIKSGFHTSVAFREDNSIIVWGYNCYGQITNCPVNLLPIVELNKSFADVVKGNMDRETTPVVRSIGFKDVACGFYHLLGLRENGSIYKWGYSFADENLIKTDYYSAKRENYPLGIFKEVSSAFSTCAAITTNGELKIWGENTSKNIANEIFVKVYCISDGFGDYTIAIHQDGSIYKFKENKMKHYPGKFIKFIGRTDRFGIAIKENYTIQRIDI